jgi:hypothetical protein
LQFEKIIWFLRFSVGVDSSGGLLLEVFGTGNGALKKGCRIGCAFPTGLSLCTVFECVDIKLKSTAGNNNEARRKQQQKSAVTAETRRRTVRGFLGFR